MVSIEVNGKSADVPEGSSIEGALDLLGFDITMFPSDGGLFMPCKTGGCWTCNVNVDGELCPACVSKVRYEDKDQSWKLNS
jgi:pyruvate formate lyase activating enzyme